MDFWTDGQEIGGIIPGKCEQEVNSGLNWDIIYGMVARYPPQLSVDAKTWVKIVATIT